MHLYFKCKLRIRVGQGHRLCLIANTKFINNMQDNELRLSDKGICAVIIIKCRISTVIRLIRVFKLTLMAILHLIIHNMVISVIILSLIQTISMVLFLFKFTYQKCIYEHALLIGVFCGIVSSVERLVETIFGFPYLFLGEIISIYFFWGKNTFLQSAL